MEDIKIGKMRADAEAIHGSPLHLHWLRHQPDIMRHYYRLVYRWDCALEPGGNPIPDKPYEIQPVLVVPDITRGGQTIDSAAKIRRLFDAVGVRRGDTAALNAELVRAVTPGAVDVGRFLTGFPFDATHKVDLLLYVRLGWLRLTRAGPGPLDHYLLGLPVRADFFHAITGYCNGGDEVETPEAVDMGTGQIDFPEEGDDENLHHRHWLRVWALARRRRKGLDWVDRQIGKVPIGYPR